MGENENSESLEQAHAAARETSRLASFILKQFPNEPGSIGDSESAVDVAIRIMQREGAMREQFGNIAHDRDRWRELTSRFLGAACDGEDDPVLWPLKMAESLLADFRSRWEKEIDSDEDPDATDRALIAAELMIEKIKIAVGDGIAIVEGKPTTAERMETATLIYFRQRFGELATASRELVAVIREAKFDGRLDSRQTDAFHKLQSALPEPKDAPVQLTTSIKSIEKAAAVCAILADLTQTFVGKLEGPREVLDQLADAIGLALEARGETGPAEAPGFQIGRCYRHSGGEDIMVVGRVQTTLYGECLVGESNKASDLKPLGMDADAMQNWKEIPRAEFGRNFDDGREPAADNSPA